LTVPKITFFNSVRNQPILTPNRRPSKGPADVLAIVHALKLDINHQRLSPWRRRPTGVVHLGSQPLARPADEMSFHLGEPTGRLIEEMQDAPSKAADAGTKL